MLTKTYQNPLQNAHKKELTISFDETANDPVTYYLSNNQVWGADLAAFSSLFWRGDVNILDIGSNIGSYSVLAASATKGKVYCIEADPKNFELLKQNKENNSFDNLVPLNFAASDESGEVSFCQAGPGGHVKTEGWGNDSVSVAAHPVDDLLAGARIDFIKLDVEGYEIKALDGLKKTIGRDSPPIVFEVNGFTLKWFDKTPNDLLAKLESFGYRIFVLKQRLIPINSYEPFPFGVVDCVAMKEHHIPVIQHLITLPLSEPQRVNILQESNFQGNEDMKGYFSWYREKVKL